MIRVVFIGTGEIGVPSLRWLLSSPHVQVVASVTQPDKPAGRNLALRSSPIKDLSLLHHLPVLQPLKLRSPDSIASLSDLHPDLIVVMAYGQILPQEILSLPTLACLNLHASLLPRWRGAAPIQASILANDPTTGITVMYMAEGLDTGDILSQLSLPIRRRETAGSLHDRLAHLAALALANALPPLLSHQAPRLPQDESQANYAPKLRRENGTILWNQSSAEIERQIRAMNPWPAAHTLIPSPNGPRQLKVFSAIQYRRQSGPPGVVLRSDHLGILVGTGSTALLLRQIQLEGKRPMPAPQFLLGHPLHPGTVLGGV